VEITPNQSWTTNTPRRWPWSKADSTKFGPKEINSGGIELSRIASYVMVIALLACCMLLSAWSRIDLRETAVSLDRSERDLSGAQAEGTRLRLELATLEDPAWLSTAADSLQLDRDVRVIDVPPAVKSD
jgi:hypothetical protein